jgi:hypothetical protein
MKLLPILFAILLLTPACALQSADEAIPLVRALTSSNWSWENSDGGRKSIEEIQFYRGGFAHNPKWFTARWETNGPRTIALHNTNYGTNKAGTVAYLVFDAQFTHFAGFDFNGKTTVEGFRREALDPERPAPADAPGAAEKRPDSIIAASDTAQEFDRLTAERDKTLATAADPINRLYQTALEALLRRATLANNLDTAVRIKEALDKHSAKAQIVGAWNFVNHTDGVEAVVEFKPDNTFLWNGQEVALWTTNQKHLIITHHNRGGHQDYYDLPVRDGKLDGTNTPGQKLTITRKTE